MKYDDEYDRKFLNYNKKKNNVKKIQNIYKEKDILSVYECARTLNTTKEKILDEILLGEIIHIGNVRSLINPLVFKRDLLNYADRALDCNILSYKKNYTNILSSYPNELYDIHIMNILDLPNIQFAYYFIKNNPELDYYSHYNFQTRKTEINKEIFINFLISHRKRGYVNNISNYINTYQYQNMNENYCGNIFPVEITTNKQIIQNEENIPKGYNVIRPFKFINSKVDLNKYIY